MNWFTLTRGNIAFVAAFIAVIFVFTVMFTTCTGKETENNIKALPEGTMLIDYYRTEKTADKSGYIELVLYTTENSNMVKLSIYNKDGDNTYERHNDYIVSYEAAETCYKLIEKHNLNLWNEMENAVSEDGVLVVCKYFTDGEYVRVSTEKMPENGADILNSIAAVMLSYANDECSIELKDT